MQNISNKYLKDLELNKPASIELIQDVEKNLGIKFPEDYIDFMLFSNGCEGSIGENYIILWNTEDIIENNENYEVQTYAPNIVIFGSNGGGEAFGFDMRNKNIKYIMLPFMFDYNDIIDQGYFLNDFFERLYSDTLFDR